jgi:hypothetical protein
MCAQQTHNSAVNAALASNIIHCENPLLILLLLLLLLYLLPPIRDSLLFCLLRTKHLLRIRICRLMLRAILRQAKARRVAPWLGIAGEAHLLTEFEDRVVAFLSLQVGGRCLRRGSGRGSVVFGGLLGGGAMEAEAEEADCGCHGEWW